MTQTVFPLLLNIELIPVLCLSIPILASSGKLDKKALPAVDCQSRDEEQEGRPSTDTERKLEPLWAEVLQQKHVDVQESFFDLGGHSLLATKMLNKVMETFNIELTVKDLFVHSTISSMADLLDQHDPDKPHRKLSLVPELDLMREVDNHDQAVLDMDIQLRAFWRSMQVIDKWLTGRVLLTGATGFLGVFILKDLLENTKSQIFCLVREWPNQTGIDRIRSTMVQYGILDRTDESTSDGMSLDSQIRSRVTVFNGDVGLMNMGLIEDDYLYLCTEIDYIVHAAAHVNLIYPYEALRGPNVLGTENIVKFACTSKIKPIHHISTDAVFPHGMIDCMEDADMTQQVNKLEDGYSQSKWVAEQLVKRAMDRGLPAVIYRLGNLSGETNKAFWNPQDFNLLMIKGCASLKSAPDVDWNIEMTPVNFVSNFIVSLVRKMSLALGKIFHIINPNTIKASWLFEWMLAHGYPVEVIPFEEWKERDKTYFSQLSSFKQDTLNGVLKTLNLTYPVINSSILEIYFSHLSKRGIIPSPRQINMAQQLAGCVAIVTGASSGIGAAIAQQLALAGAHVAMAARRQDKLDEIKKKIEKEGGVAIAIKCDVTNRDEVSQSFKGLSQGLRLELAKTGVKVTCIQPGDVYTELQSHTTDQEAKDAFMSGSGTALRPEDIANAVVYAVTQPSYAAVNEILIEPREAPI
ncbi:hypothetical protein LSH36_48g05032 [Paralvinella palmiformis]|uniref:Carrier domain-containing protein n=1 Tax=Paralvinella palmiformis TaxID=53620 RepID=A0AAD9K6A0_9ANNE|nr:hypothetical protein LSH36_48g05032 [Paralvinella palmiformis]